MSWTLQQYLDRVKALAADQEPIDADITAWVNEMRGILQPHAKLEASGSVALVNGTAAYNPPTGFYEAVFLYRQDTATSEQSEIEPVGDYDRASTGYRLFAGQFVFQPTPGASDAGKLVYVEFYKRVGRTSDAGDLSAVGDIFNIDEQFHDLPFLHACMRAKQQDSEFGEGRDFAAEFRGRMAEFRAASGKKRRQSARRLRAVRYW